LYSVFDPNDPLLRAQLTEITERFLKPLKNDGRALYDFRVECSDKNNPPSVVSQGILNLDVYLDPVLPAKQIILNGTITQTGGLKFSQA
jgi:phage tail sheath protein FI